MVDNHNPFGPPPPRNPTEQVVADHFLSEYNDHEAPIRLATVHALIELVRAVNRVAVAVEQLHPSEQPGGQQ